MALGRSNAAVRHAANLALIVRLTTELKRARAAAKVTGAALAKETMADEPAALRAAGAKSKGVVPVQKTVGKKVIKKVIVKGKPGRAVAPPPVAPSTVGRPQRDPNECSQCRRLREKRRGGHGHVWWCPKAKHARVAP